MSCLSICISLALHTSIRSVSTEDKITTHFLNYFSVVGLFLFFYWSIVVVANVYTARANTWHTRPKEKKTKNTWCDLALTQHSNLFSKTFQINLLECAICKYFSAGPKKETTKEAPNGRNQLFNDIYIYIMRRLHGKITYHYEFVFLFFVLSSLSPSLGVYVCLRVYCFFFCESVHVSFIFLSPIHITRSIHRTFTCMNVYFRRFRFVCVIDSENKQSIKGQLTKSVHSPFSA